MKNTANLCRTGAQHRFMTLYLLIAIQLVMVTGQTNDLINSTKDYEFEMYYKSDCTTGCDV